MRSSALVLLLLFGCGSSADANAEHWSAPSAITSLHFDPEIIAALGVRIRALSSSADSVGFPGHSFRTRPPSLLEFRAPHAAFERFDRGSLFHVGGLVLELPARRGRVSLEGFELRAAAPPIDFELLDRTGRRLFVLRDMQFTTSLADGEFRLLNLSIHLAPELARMLGRSDLEGAFVGDANIRLPALFPPDLVVGGAGSGAGSGMAAGESCQQTEGPIDVELTGLHSVSQVAREAGVRVALAPAATLLNVGIGSVDWYESIDPVVYDAWGPHPYLSTSMVRLDPDGRLVQLGLGDVKHAFRALNLGPGCACGSDVVLYPGCGDVYGVSTNRNRRYLAPRAELTAFTGAWERVASHFDQCLALGELSCDPGLHDADGIRDHEGDSPPGFFHDSFEHRLVVPESGLAVAGARYFVEAWYLVAGDVDIFNSMGRLRVVPRLEEEIWSFQSADLFVNGSVLDEIPGAAIEPVDTGEGRLQLAVKTSDLGGGVHHYEYTLMNFDFDRQIEGFAVPLPPGVDLTNPESRALFDDPAGDWLVSLDGAAIRWDAPPGAGLDWGMFVSFGFDADAIPVQSAVTLAVLEPGFPTSLRVPAAAPVPEPDAQLLVGIALAALGGIRRYGGSGSGR